MQIWAWESVHYRRVFLEYSNALLHHRSSFHVCSVLFHGWLHLLTTALVWRLKGSVARCWPRCFQHFTDWFGLRPLSFSLCGVLICSVTQVFRPTWFLKSEMSRLISDLGLWQSSVMRLVHLSQCARLNLFMLHRQLFFTGSVAFFFPKITRFQRTLFFFIILAKNTQFCIKYCRIVSHLASNQEYLLKSLMIYQTVCCLWLDDPWGAVFLI